MTENIKGVDVSKHQGRINWAKVKNDGISFAMIRAGYGNGNKDRFFDENIKNATANGIKCGVYWFSYAYNAETARKEAAACLEIIRPYKIDYPVAFDFEYDTVTYAKRLGITVTKEIASEIADIFLSTVKAAGYRVINYTNIDYYNNFFNSKVKEKYDVWLAAYRKKEPNYGQKIWQFTDSGKVDGISGKVDMNISHYENEKIGGDTVNVSLPVLKNGSKGNSVKAVQNLLIAKHYFCGKSGADGDFGTNTDNAVKRYQKDMGLTVDGIIGAATWKSILTT